MPSQLSLFGAEAADPSLADLAGLLAGPGQLGRMGGTARVSVRVDAAWRVHVLVAELVVAGSRGELGADRRRPDVTPSRSHRTPTSPSADAGDGLRWSPDGGPERRPTRGADGVLQPLVRVWRRAWLDAGPPGAAPRGSSSPGRGCGSGSPPRARRGPGLRARLVADGGARHGGRRRAGPGRCCRSVGGGRSGVPDHAVAAAGPARRAGRRTARRGARRGCGRAPRCVIFGDCVRHDSTFAGVRCRRRTHAVAGPLPSG